MTGFAPAAPSAAVYAAADGLLTSCGHSFHWARRLLDQQHAERATRLYGFCRRLDDLADRATDAATAHAALAIVRHALQTGSCTDAETADMLQLMHECGIDVGIPLQLMDGIESDLGEVRIRDMDELLRYCYQVAGTVGLMMTAVLDVHAAEALPHAIDLGIAMQLTNICRDVREDAALGRRYLPASLVGPMEPAALVDPTPEVRAVAADAVRILLATADRHYECGELGLRYVPVGARMGMRVAARLYQGIGTVLRERKFDGWSSRARVGTASKVSITLRALVQGAFAQPGGAARAPLAVALGARRRHPAPAPASESGVAD